MILFRMNNCIIFLIIFQVVHYFFFQEMAGNSRKNLNQSFNLNIGLNFSDALIFWTISVVLAQLWTNIVTILK